MHQEAVQIQPSIVFHFSFFNNPGYKAYLENAVSFNRKLNEERKMRLPFIDSQTGKNLQQKK